MSSKDLFTENKMFHDLWAEKLHVFCGVDVNRIRELIINLVKNYANSPERQRCYLKDVHERLAKNLGIPVSVVAGCCTEILIKYNEDLKKKMKKIELDTIESEIFALIFSSLYNIQNGSIEPRYIGKRPSSTFKFISKD